MKTYPGILILMLGVLLAVAGCDDDEDEERPAAAQTATAQTAAAKSEPKGEAKMEWETRTDPVEHAFTIELPGGWKNDAYLKRDGVVTFNVATSTSPDGATALFYGDPKMPKFVEPSAALPHQRNDPTTRIQSYTAAEQFLPGYLKGRFGKLPGFQITHVASEPELVQKNREAAAKSGVPLTQLHSARVDFTFQDGASPRRGAVYGSTFSVGMVWLASVAGIVSNDDPLRHKAALFHIIESQKTDPAWKRQEQQAAADRQAQHERAMAQIARNTEILRMNHQSNMATLQGMAARHQLRMDAIHAAGEASMAAYRQRDAASDASHQGFLNVIREEHTVSTSGGRTFQVDNKYDRYFINKNDNTYIGLKGAADLNNLQGVNPHDYEEAKILR